MAKKTTGTTKARTAATSCQPALGCTVDELIDKERKENKDE